MTLVLRALADKGGPEAHPSHTLPVKMCAQTSQRLLLICAAQGSLQLLLGHCLPLTDGVDGVGVARHDGKPFGVVPVAAQEGENLVACIRQDDVPLQVVK